MEDERALVAATCRRLAADGLVIGTAGNVSVRRDDRVAVTATGARFETITADEVTVVDLDGRVRDGGPAPTSEIGLHLGIYQRFGSSAVVHTHAPAATAVGLVVDELPCVHYQMLQLGGSVRVAPYALFGSARARAGRCSPRWRDGPRPSWPTTAPSPTPATWPPPWSTRSCWSGRAISTGGPPRWAAPARSTPTRSREVVAAVMARGYGTIHPTADGGAAMTTTSDMTVIALGAHVLDTLVRPVEAIPDGQGGQLVEEIRSSAAGPAGGTALVLSKLGATARSAGAIGTDALGDQLLALLARDGVDTTHLIRREDVQTSASVLPIRPDGSRPAFHVIGANAAYGPDDAPWEAIAAATHLHLGGPEFMGGDAAARILSFAREHGV